MPEVTARFGGKQGRTLALVTNEDLIVVRSREPLSLSRDAHLSARALSVLGDYEPHLQFSAACVEVFRARRDGSATQRDKALAVLKQEPSLRFAGRVLTSPVLAAARPEYKDPVIYTQNYFVKFARTVPLSKVRKALAARDLKLKREVEYLENAYFVAAPENSPLEAVFQKAESLLGETEVQYCHPELVRERSFRATFPAPQWHLGKTKVGGKTIDQHARVAAAWERARGRGTTIAIIDTGIDLDHEEFAGVRKVVSPRDATGQDADPRPAASHREDHGTA